MGKLMFNPELEQGQALAASFALLDNAKEDTGYLIDQLDRAITGGLPFGACASSDAQSTARRLMQVLSSLEKIGWPHELADKHRLYELRLAAEMSVDELVEKSAGSSFDHRDIRRWEQGEPIEGAFREPLARTFGVSVEWLIGEAA